MIYLTRWADTPFGIFGTLSIDEGFQCFTVERNWHNNLPFKSCIPEGEYVWHEDTYNRGGYKTIELRVEGRTRILVHKGNVHTDVQGCIAVGTKLGLLDGEWAVLNSKGAFENFSQILGLGKSGAVGGRIIVRWKSEGQGGDRHGGPPR